MSPGRRWSKGRAVKAESAGGWLAPGAPPGWWAIAEALGVWATPLSWACHYLPAAAVLAGEGAQS